MSENEDVSPTAQALGSTNTATVSQDSTTWQKLKKLFEKSSKAQRDAKQKNRFGNMGNRGAGKDAYQEAANTLEESYGEGK